jgi:hypothetical protein
MSDVHRKKTEGTRDVDGVVKPIAAHLVSVSSGLGGPAGPCVRMHQSDYKHGLAPKSVNVLVSRLFFHKIAASSHGRLRGELGGRSELMRRNKRIQEGPFTS